ncbi:multidrug effflux MFS transporter [Streptomyces phyllanthi]|uniref:Multidrug effflux MFS transporter n=3 Tax=Streptomyces phyllanthi TaxID=1803180 RepID=A0A5N8W7N1_9ACTN|nr:multidrug effflux MFS transporter [Streptomyces phyllanthi]
MGHAPQGVETLEGHTAERGVSAAFQGPGERRNMLLVLGLLTALGPFAIDMYVPGFPAMSAALHTGPSAIQLTLTAFLAGVVVGQFLIGPVSDALGRRRPLIVGCAGFVVSALACALAPSIGVLLATRFIQGIAGAAGMVLARAVIADRFRGHDVPRYMALLGQILCVAPVIAPVIGGGILAVSSWRAIFVALCALGAVLLVAVIAKVPETLAPEQRHQGGPADTFRAMGRLACHRAFLGNTLVLGFSSAALFGYISGSSFVFEHIHGVSAGVFALIFAVNSVGQLIAGAVFAKLAHRLRINTLLAASVALTATAALAQVLITALLGESFAGSWITQFVFLSGIGMAIPATMTLGQNLGRHASGAASALLGGLQFLFGAAGSSLVGLFGQNSSLPMGLVMLTSMALAVLCLVVLVRPRQGHGEVAVH